MRTGQLVLLVLRAYIGDLIEHPLLHAALDEGHQEGRRQLYNERGPWRNLDVVTQLHVLHKSGTFRQRLQSQGLEDHVGDRLTGKDGSGNNLRYDVD